MNNKTSILPRISIITPVYNRASMIEQTILSVLSQGYDNLEYIIIDGGSTDGTIDIIRKYADRLTYWVSEPDGGMYEAIMKGISCATGDVMAWINSDDMYHPGALQIVGEIFATLPDVDWLTGTPTMYNTESICVKVFPTIRWSWAKFKSGNFRWIQQESTFWRRSLWDKAGAKLNLDYRLAADFELWTRFFQYAQLYTVNTVLGGFRLHGAQLSIGQNQKYEDEVRMVCQTMNMSYQPSCRMLNRFAFVFKHLYKYPNIITFDFEKGEWQK